MSEWLTACYFWAAAPVTRTEDSSSNSGPPYLTQLLPAFCSCFGTSWGSCLLPFACCFVLCPSWCISDGRFWPKNKECTEWALPLLRLFILSPHFLFKSPKGRDPQRGQQMTPWISLKELVLLEVSRLFLLRLHGSHKHRPQISVWQPTSVFTVLSPWLKEFEVMIKVFWNF